MNPTRAESSQICWVLRVGAAMEFIGHGMLGINRVAAWTSYFAVVGISHDTALRLMPLVGMMDVTLGLCILLFPMRGAILYMAAWGFWTAILRPLAGESAWEAVERAGNFGALLGLYFLCEGGSENSWFGFRPVSEWSPALCKRVAWTLRLTTSLLLIGHGALNLLVRKKIFVTQYALLGMAPGAEPVIGAFEFVLGAAALAWPRFGFLVFILGWKLATEALNPVAGSTIWVFVEHGGSYAAPLALALLVGRRSEPEAARVRGSYA